MREFHYYKCSYADQVDFCECYFAIRDAATLSPRCPRCGKTIYAKEITKEEWEGSDAKN